MKYVSAKEAKKFFDISGQTLKLWKDKGLINFKQYSSKKILYDIDSLNNNNSDIDDRQNVIYARVSCSNQKQSLENQIELIKQYMISNGIKVDEIYSEIASGFNAAIPVGSASSYFLKFAREDFTSCRRLQSSAI